MKREQIDRKIFIDLWNDVFPKYCRAYFCFNLWDLDHRLKDVARSEEVQLMIAVAFATLDKREQRVLQLMYGFSQETTSRCTREKVATMILSIDPKAKDGQTTTVDDVNSIKNVALRKMRGQFYGLVKEKGGAVL